MTTKELIEILGKFPENLEVVMMSELQGNFVRVKAEPRHIRVINPGKRGVEEVRGVWSPRFHRKEEKGKEVLILW